MNINKIIRTLKIIRNNALDTTNKDYNGANQLLLSLDELSDADEYTEDFQNALNKNGVGYIPDIVADMSGYSGKEIDYLYNSPYDYANAYNPTSPINTSKVADIISALLYSLNNYKQNLHDQNLTKSLKSLNKKVNSKNIQDILVKVNDLYDDSYLLADDNLYDLFNYKYNILSRSEAYSSIQEDCDPANGKDVVKANQKDLQWLDDHKDLAFVHWTNVKQPITVQEVHAIIKELKTEAKPIFD